jgi:serum/glucocorticoid-regulated kinase 2
MRCVYRDLKPENVLISASGHAKLADLGLVKMLFDREKTFTTCGTPEYISPEVIDGMGYDEMCDWWQLGILLYEMIAGRTPFNSESSYELYSNILTKQLEFTDQFDEVAKDFLAKLLHKNPYQRIHQSDILNHDFFGDMSWEEVKRLGLTPPFVPTLSDPLDTSYFEDFKEKRWEEGTIEDSLQAEFEGY